MKWQSILALVTTAAALATPAQAGILFGKKKPAPVDPNQRVPELLDIVKTSPDEHKRAQAAEELRKYDPQAFPDMVPVLIDVLANDPKPSVRVEAVQTLGKLRPISPPVGQALEQAVAKDTSMRVRLQARSSLLQYHWSGYRTPKKDASPPQTKEPPLAPPLPGELPAPAQAVQPVAPPVARPAAAIGPPVISPTPPSRSVQPPVTAPGESPPPVMVTPAGPMTDPSVPVIRMTPVPAGARPLPLGPVNPTPMPVAPNPPPAPTQGPDLTLPPRW
ncbi:MAG TPA: HEAT repeat domain-containing protein [Gemmataceae bacterium]|nr:HEAT repeat domain-containing protein [Gemmataceae bacterium]